MIFDNNRTTIRHWQCWSLSLCLTVLTTTSVFAQKDTQKKKALSEKENAVTITSEYVPTLRNSSKINFSGNTPLPLDRVPSLQYEVPSTPMFFPYIPGSLRPLSLDIDSARPWKNEGFVKLGYGNMSTPYGEAGVSFGDGTNSAYALHVKHTQSKGKMELQKFANTQADLNGVYHIAGNNELTGKLYFDQKTVYAYGIRPADSLLWNRDSAKLSYATYGLKLGLRNLLPALDNFDYNPTLSMNIFSHNWDAHESNLVLDAPVSYAYSENISFGASFLADVTGYKHNGKSVTNTIVSLKPNVSYKTDIWKIYGALAPTSSQGKFKLLPEISGEYKLNEEKFVLQAGYKSYFNKNTYKSLVEYNPWISAPDTLKNTRNNEFYAGFKGTAGSHFFYNAKLSVIKAYDNALFMNDSALGNRFYTLFEPKMNIFRLHGELGYKNGEKFSLIAGLTYNGYSSLDSNAKAWGLIPFEMTASLRWQVVPSLWLKSDLFLWNGAYYKDWTTQSSDQLKGVSDWSVGLEYKITNNWSAWLQVNNMLNSKYQRWNQYPNMGVNVLGGVIYNFDLKRF